MVIAMYSGALEMVVFPNNNYLKNMLKITPAGYLTFYSFVQSAWILKPLFGFVSDTFYPFKSKIKVYIIVHCTIQIVLTAAFFFVNPGLELLTFYVFMIYYCVGFVDALGEGMTAVITKMEIRLSDLKSEEEKKKIFMDDIEKRSVGNYFQCRMALRCIGTFFGGFFA